jgi:hypothetical protein
LYPVFAEPQVRACNGVLHFGNFFSDRAAGFVPARFGKFALYAQLLFEGLPYQRLATGADRVVASLGGPSASATHNLQEPFAGRQ